MPTYRDIYGHYAAPANDRDFSATQEAVALLSGAEDTIRQNCTVFQADRQYCTSVMSNIYRNLREAFHTFSIIPKNLRDNDRWIIIPPCFASRYIWESRTSAIIVENDYGHPIANAFTFSHEVGHIINSAKMSVHQRKALRLSRKDKLDHGYLSSEYKKLLLADEQAAWIFGKQLFAELIKNSEDQPYQAYAAILDTYFDKFASILLATYESIQVED